MTHRMPPNAKGGKNYKKRKTGGGDAQDMDALYIERQKGQAPARIIRNLGSRNMLCYCNDNIMRLCHVRGAMKGRIWIEVGDIVLVSLRENIDEVAEKLKDAENRKVDRGDILAKYAPEHLSKLRKEDGVNQRLFMKLETMEGISLAEVGIDKTEAVLVEKSEPGIVFDTEENEEDEEKEIDIDNI